MYDTTGELKLNWLWIMNVLETAFARVDIKYFVAINIYNNNRILRDPSKPLVPYNVQKENEMNNVIFQVLEHQERVRVGWRKNTGFREFFPLFFYVLVFRLLGKKSPQRNSFEHFMIRSVLSESIIS